MRQLDHEEVVVTDAVRDPNAHPGAFRRAARAVWTFLQSLDSTSLDYSLDRIGRLEREVDRLREEIRGSVRGERRAS